MQEFNREEPKPFLRKVLSKKKKSVFSYEGKQESHRVEKSHEDSRTISSDMKKKSTPETISRDRIRRDIFFLKNNEPAARQQQSVGEDDEAIFLSRSTNSRTKNSSKTIRA